MTYQLKPYTIAMQEQEQRAVPVPTPAQVRQQTVDIPGVFGQTTNLFRPLGTTDINKGN
jgi:hypothetical protein